MVMKISYAYYKEDFIVNGNLHVSKKSAVSDPKFQSTEFQLTEPSMKNKKIRIKAKNYIGPNKLDAETIRRGASCSQEDEGESEREVIFPATKQLIGNLFGRFTSRENHAHSQKLAKAIHHEHTKFQERIRSKKLLWILVTLTAIMFLAVERVGKKQLLNFKNG